MNWYDTLWYDTFLAVDNNKLDAETTNAIYLKRLDFLIDSFLRETYGPENMEKIKSYIRLNKEQANIAIGSEDISFTIIHPETGEAVRQYLDFDRLVNMYQSARYLSLDRLAIIYQSARDTAHKILMGLPSEKIPDAPEKTYLSETQNISQIGYSGLLDKQGGAIVNAPEAVHDILPSLDLRINRSHIPSISSMSHSEILDRNDLLEKKIQEEEMNN